MPATETQQVRCLSCKHEVPADKAEETRRGSGLFFCERCQDEDHRQELAGIRSLTSRL